jgi:hypothetical protein
VAAGQATTEIADQSEDVRDEHQADSERNQPAQQTVTSVAAGESPESVKPTGAHETELETEVEAAVVAGGQDERSTSRPAEATPSVSPPADMGETDSRHPVPDPQQRAKSLAIVRELLASEFDTTAKDREPAVVDWLLNAASEKGATPTERFVLLSEARRVAIEAGLTRAAIGAVDRIDAEFRIDGWEIKIRTLAELAPTARTADRKTELAKTSLEFLDVAEAEGRFDELREIWSLARDALSNPSNNEQIALRKDVLERGKWLDELLAAWAGVKEANTILANNPVDEAANLQVGRFYCLVCEDWSEGLAYLALAGNHALAKAASVELTQPTDAVDQLKLADKWFAAAADLEGSQKESVEERAAYWYRQAVGMLTGLQKLHAETRIAALTPASSEEDEPSAAARPRPKRDRAPKLRKPIMIARTVGRSGDYEFVLNSPQSVDASRTIIGFRAVPKRPGTGSVRVRLVNRFVRDNVRYISGPSFELDRWTSDNLRGQWKTYHLRNVVAQGNFTKELMIYIEPDRYSRSDIRYLEAWWAIDPNPPQPPAGAANGGPLEREAGRALAN